MNEHILVDVERDGVVMSVPFCEVLDGDYLISQRVFVWGDAHYSGDASYDGWLLYDEHDRDWYPEDFIL